MDYLRFRELFHEFAQKLEEQSTYYFDSVIGFASLHERLVAQQEKTKVFLGNSELARDEFLDTCSTIYSQLSNKDFTPMSLSPVMKQGAVKERTKENGKNHFILGANCIVTLYSYWEEYLRIEIGIALGVLAKGAKNNEETRKTLNQHVKNDLWGDIRYLRNSIVHVNGIATSDIERCKILKFFSPGDVIELDVTKMRIIFVKLAAFRNELQSKSFAPHAAITL